MLPGSYLLLITNSGKPKGMFELDRGQDRWRKGGGGGILTPQHVLWNSAGSISCVMKREQNDPNFKCRIVYTALANCPRYKMDTNQCNKNTPLAISWDYTSQAPSVISAIFMPQSALCAPARVLSLQHASHAVHTKGLSRFVSSQQRVPWCVPTRSLVWLLLGRKILLCSHTPFPWEPPGGGDQRQRVVFLSQLLLGQASFPALDTADMHVLSWLVEWFTFRLLRLAMHFVLVLQVINGFSLVHRNHLVKRTNTRVES